MDTQDCRHVTGRREPLTCLHIAVGDVTTNLSRHLLMEWGGIGAL